jgi:hypothetical protein
MLKAGGAMTAAGFRRIALGMRDVVEGAHHGHADFRVNGRVFASLGYPDKQWGMVVLTPEQQRDRVQQDPDGFVPANGKWGEQGCTTVRLAAVNEEALGEALTLAFQHISAKGPPKRATRKRAAGPAAKPRRTRSS